MCLSAHFGGQKDRKNRSSIGPSRTGEKSFSLGGIVGFYASGHDGKMTKKWDFRAGEQKNPARANGGQSGENSSCGAAGVADSRLDLKMLRDWHQGGKQKQRSPTPVNSAFRRSGRPKKADPQEPAFYPGTVVRISVWASQILGVSNQHR